MPSLCKRSTAHRPLAIKFLRLVKSNAYQTGQRGTPARRGGMGFGRRDGDRGLVLRHALGTDLRQRRKANDEGGALAHPALHRDAAAMVLYDPLANRQAEAGTLLLGGEEGH